MRKGTVLGILVLFGCMAVGCGSETIEPQPTVAVSSTETVTVTEAPSTTPVPEGIPIDEEHFGDIGFCDLLKKEYDGDANGYFTEEELENVECLSVSPKRRDKEPYKEIKGLSYFKNLESLYLRSMEKIELCDLPNLKKIFVEPSEYVNETIQIGNFTVKNCPKLEYITASDVVFGYKGAGETGEMGTFCIENCPVLEEFSLGNAEFENITGKIAGTPKLSLRVRDGLKMSEAIILDANIRIHLSPYVTYDLVKEEVDYPEGYAFTWDNIENAVPLTTAWLDLQEKTEKIRNGFSIRVEEITPTLYDEKGQKAYYVWLENKYISKSVYSVWFRESRYRNAILYSERTPTMEQFSIDWNEPVRMEIVNYSPLLGVRTEMDSYATIGYTSGGEREEIGEIRISFYGAISENAETKLCSSGTGIWIWDDFENLETEGITLEEHIPEVYQPKEGDICIEKEQFSSVMFRRYLENYVDSDRNGYLSVEEREAVTYFDFAGEEAENDCFEGFHHFPNLRTLVLTSCKEVVCKDCLNLREIILFEEDEIGVLVVENCPQLDDINLDAWLDCESQIH